MPVLLATSDRPPKAGFDRWCAIAGAAQPPTLHPALKINELAAQLEAAFDASVEEWWNVAQALGQEPSSVYAHTPACAANISDFGQMLAWTRLVDEWAAGHETVLVVCDDPWLFRHLTPRQGVTKCSAWPALCLLEWKLAFRGLMARFAAARRFAGWAGNLRKHSMSCPKDCAALLVYAHPASEKPGFDAYFGSLMQDAPGLIRLLHVDGTPERAMAIARDGRSFSLHGFGDPAFAKQLWKVKWSPVMTSNWLIRRAAMLEGSTAQAAAIAWQMHCQQAWLDQAQPCLVAWPWENHSWERAFVRAARKRGVKTLGYQHATVGWREWNYAPHSNPDGTASLPDRIVTVGASDLARLMRYGCPRHLLSIGGALRFADPPRPKLDPKAPVYVALPFDGDIATQMVAALRPLAKAGRRFLVKDHPMNPFAFSALENIEATGLRLGELGAVSAVIYCLTTVGLESALAGLPTLRFLPEGKVVVNVMPEGVAIPSASADDLAQALEKLPPPPQLDAAQVFAKAEPAFWAEALQA